MGEATAIQTTDTPRIYIACLASYNKGIPHGAWIDATADAWAMWDGIQTMLVASPVPDAEEHAIHDHEGFGGVRIGEHTGIEEVARIAAFLAEHGAVGAAVLDYYGGDMDEAREAMADRYLGAHASLADYAQELTEDNTTIPATLQYYIDWPAMARDAEMSGDLFTIATAWDEVHVFASN